MTNVSGDQEFVDVIRAIRKELGLTQFAFGRLVAASKNTICRWENGAWLPSRIRQQVLLERLEGSISKPMASALARSMLADPTQERPYVEPPPARPLDLVAARAAFDASILAGAEALDLSPRKVRALVVDVLAVAERLGLDARTARAVVAKGT